MKFKFSLYLLLIPILLLSCNISNIGNDNKIEETVDSFVTNYYNWRYDKAINYCTNNSRKWLSFAASNVTQKDINIINSTTNNFSYTIKNITINDNDTTASVLLNIENFYHTKDIDSTAYLIKSAHIELSLLLINNIWKINLKDLPKPITNYDLIMYKK